MVPIPIFLEHFWWCYNTCKVHNSALLSTCSQLSAASAFSAVPVVSAVSAMGTREGEALSESRSSPDELLAGEPLFCGVRALRAAAPSCALGALFALLWRPCPLRPSYVLPLRMVTSTMQEACSRDPSIPMPAYFRFLTLLALRLFSQLKVLHSRSLIHWLRHPTLQALPQQQLTRGCQWCPILMLASRGMLGVQSMLVSQRLMVS